MSDIKRVWANPESLWSEGRVKFVEGVELVYASDYDAAQIELAALREELDIIKDECIDHVNLYKAWTKQRDEMQQRLIAAEQRNAELIASFECVRVCPSKPLKHPLLVEAWGDGVDDAIAALKSIASGASE